MYAILVYSLFHAFISCGPRCGHIRFYISEKHATRTAAMDVVLFVCKAGRPRHGAHSFFHIPLTDYKEPLRAPEALTGFLCVMFVFTYHAQGTQNSAYTVRWGSATIVWKVFL